MTTNQSAAPTETQYILVYKVTVERENGLIVFALG